MWARSLQRKVRYASTRGTQDRGTDRTCALSGVTRGFCATMLRHLARLSPCRALGPAFGPCRLRAGRAFSSIKLPDNFFDEISEGARPQEKGTASGIYIGSSPPRWRELLELARASHPPREWSARASGGSPGDRTFASRGTGLPSSNSRRHKKERLHAAAVRVRHGRAF